MEMDHLTPTLLREQVDRIDVYETESTGKNCTQQGVIHYRFAGYVDFQPTNYAETSKPIPARMSAWSISQEQQPDNTKEQVKACSYVEKPYENPKCECPTKKIFSGLPCQLQMLCAISFALQTVLSH